MAKKNKKSEKLNLSEFLGPNYTSALPSAPSARDPNAPDDQRGFRDNRRGGFGEEPSSDTWRRGPRGSGEDDSRPQRRFDQETPSSKADEDTEWRKSRPQSGRSGGFEGPPRGGSAGDDPSEWRRRQPERPTPPPSAADESTEWRRREPLRVESAPPPVSASPADDASEWRRREPRSEGPQTSIADDATEWRRKQPLKVDAPAPPISMADEATEWRRKEPIKTESPALPNAAEADANWRKSTRSTGPEEPTPTPRPSENDDWRSNKPQLPPKEDVPRHNRNVEADVVDDWRAAAKLKKINNSTPSKRKRDLVSVDSEVLTPFGRGILIEERASDNIRVVKLEFGAKAYLRSEDVIPVFSKEVNTPYGKGEFITHRFADGMSEVLLVSGGRAFMRMQDLIESNSKVNAKQPSGNKRGSQGSSTGSRRRYGDQERDRERENAFARGERRGRETPEEGSERSSRTAELFSAFSSGKDKKTAAPPTVSAEEREKAFAAFGGGDKTARAEANPPSARLSREEKEKAFAPFSSGPRRGDRDRAADSAPPSSNNPPRAMTTASQATAAPPPTANAPNAFAAFDRGTNAPRERTTFPGFGGDRRDRERDDRPSFGDSQARSQTSFPGFGGDRRDRRSDPRGAERPAGGEERYVGGMERINANRGGVPRVSDTPTPSSQGPPQVSSESRDEFPSLVTKTPEPVDLVSKMLPKGSKWGEDDDDVPAASSKASRKEAPSAPPKKVTVDIALTSLRSIVKEYMIGENKGAAIAAMSKIATDDDAEFLTAFIASLSAESFAGTKQKKLVSGLLVEMSKAGTLSKEVVAEGLTRTLEPNVADADKVATLKEIFATLQEKIPELGQITLRGEGSKLRDDNKNSSASSGSNVDEIALAVYNAGPAGLEKMKEVQFAKLPGAGLALLKVVLKNAKLDEPSCSWIDKNAKTLGAVLFNASTNEQIKAIEAVQIAFNGIGFPKTSAGALIDKVFTQLYNLDVLPDEAFMAWKDDLSLNSAGRDKAIIQTTNFFQELESYEVEDDDE